MSDVLIRNVPADDLDQIRAAAAAHGTSVQSYLLDALHAQATYLRRRTALTRTAERLRSQREVPTEERAAILQAIADAHSERSDQLSGQRAQ
jgi:plasmid stability protein